MSSNQTALDFASAARMLGREARRHGLVAPSFRCPPRIVGVQRSVRRHRSGAVVAVQLKGRPWLAVLADMIEGVVVANELDPPSAARLRTELWASLDGAPSGVSSSTVDTASRVAGVGGVRGGGVSRGAASEPAVPVDAEDDRPSKVA